MSIEQLTEIARKRYETGAYGTTHFVMAPDVRATLFEQYPASEAAPWDPAGSISRLMSIPIVPDDSLPAGKWELRSNADDSVVLAGDLGESQ